METFCSAQIYGTSDQLPISTGGRQGKGGKAERQVILEADAGSGQATAGTFEPVVVNQTHYAIAKADVNNCFLTRNRFTKAQVTCTRWVFLTSPR